MIRRTAAGACKADGMLVGVPLRAVRWKRMLEAGSSIAETAERGGVACS